MDEGSAYRLRRHPDAEGFRRAWAVAVQRTWLRVEQTALERVIHGETEVIERDGEVVMTRRRPCSDRLMVHMLRQQLHQRDLEIEALAAARAAVEHANRYKPEGARAALPLDAAAAETAALRELQAGIEALPDSHGWDARVLATTMDHDGPVPPLLRAPRVLAPADGRLGMRARPARMRDDGCARVRDAAADRKARKTAFATGLSHASLAATAGIRPQPAGFDGGEGARAGP